MEIVLEDVWYSYDGKTYAVISANLRVGSKGLYLIIGPNGSGKTTLLKIIALLYKPTRGKVLVNGVDFWNLNSKNLDEIKGNIVYVHDRPIMVRGDVEYNLKLGLMLRGSNNWDYLTELIERYGLKGLLRVNAKSLSSGQKRIVSIVRALALKPKILVLDEPFNYLDREKARTLMEDLYEISKSSTVVMATHYVLGGLYEVAYEVYEMIAGSLRKLR